MRAEWLEVKRGDVMPQYAGISVTMNAKGVIAMSRPTYQLMGEPAAFLVLFDRVNSRVGLKPATASTPNAYPALVSNRCGAKMVRAFRLIREHRIILPHTLRFYDADIDTDGILVLDLRTAKPCPRAIARAKRPNAPTT